MQMSPRDIQTIQCVNILCKAVNNRLSNWIRAWYQNLVSQDGGIQRMSTGSLSFFLAPILRSARPARRFFFSPYTPLGSLFTGYWDIGEPGIASGRGKKKWNGREQYSAKKRREFSLFSHITIATRQKLKRCNRACLWGLEPSAPLADLSAQRVRSHLNARKGRLGTRPNLGEVTSNRVGVLKY